MQGSSLVQDRSTEAIQHAKAWGNNNFQNLTSLFGFIIWSSYQGTHCASLTRNRFSRNRLF